MATITNNSRNKDGFGSSAGIVWGIMTLLIVSGLLFFFYALPAMRGTNAVVPQNTQNNSIEVGVGLKGGETGATPLSSPAY